MVASDNYH